MIASDAKVSQDARERKGAFIWDGKDIVTRCMFNENLERINFCTGHMFGDFV